MPMEKGGEEAIITSWFGKQMLFIIELNIKLKKVRQMMRRIHLIHQYKSQRTT